MLLGKWEGASGKKNDQMPKREGLIPGRRSDAQAEEQGL